VCNLQIKVHKVAKKASTCEEVEKRRKLQIRQSCDAKKF
jgi:hypothetical protein